MSAVKIALGLTLALAVAVFPAVPALADDFRPNRVVVDYIEPRSDSLQGVYERMKKSGVLEELGVVRHVHLAHGPARYELTDVADQVRHLACEGCGRDVVVPAALFDDLRATIEHEYGFVMDSGHFAIPGRCRDCAE